MGRLENRIVLITGASSGIGAACARAFAAEGARVILAARRREKLLDLAAQLIGEGASSPLVMELDVTDRAAVQHAIASLPEEWEEIDVLVNNAGLSRGLDKFQDASLDDWEEMIQTNVLGLMYVTRAVVPGMVARNRGHIINMSSVAGLDVYPKGNGYCASKFAASALSESLAVDLVDTKIRVTDLCPGLVGGTEFSTVRFHGDAEKAAKPYQGIEALEPEDVADCAVFAATRPARMQVNRIVLTATNQATGWLIHRES
jgi:3-hydroxy acid dehydrogenase/malonic semialdehyde reductase